MSVRVGLVAMALAMAASGAQAQEIAPTRCALFAQVSTASLLQLAGALSAGDETAIDRHTGRLAQLTGTYDRLGCDAGALGQAFDCVLTTTQPEGPRAAAQQCLITARLIAGSE